MQLRADSLARHLRKELARLYIVYGDEHLLVQEALDEMRAAARAAAYTQRSIFTVERGFDWSQVLGVSQSMSLFGERQLLELRIPSGKPGKEGAEVLKRLAAEPQPERVILIILPRLDAATQKAAWFTALLQAGVALRIDRIERAALPAWIGQRLAAQGQNVAPGEAGQRTLQLIVERVEGNLLAAHQEIQKLGLIYPRGELSAEQIRDAILNVARYDVFKLSEAMLAGDVRRLSSILDGLRGEGEASMLVLWALVEELRMLLLLKRGIAAGRPLPLLLREQRVWGPREKLIGAALTRLNEAALLAGLAFAARLDRQLKGLAQLWATGSRSALLPADPWHGLFELAMTVAQPNQSKKWCL